MVASLREPKAFARELGIFSTANSSASHVAAYVSQPRTALRCSNHAIRELCRSPDHGAACRTGKEIGGSKRRPCCTHLDYVLSSFGKLERVSTSVSSRRRRNSSFPPNAAYFETLSFHSMKIRFNVQDITMTITRMITRKTGILKSDENATTLRAAPRECIVAKG